MGTSLDVHVGFGIRFLDDDAELVTGDEYGSLRDIEDVLTKVLSEKFPENFGWHKDFDVEVVYAKDNPQAVYILFKGHQSVFGPRGIPIDKIPDELETVREWREKMQAHFDFTLPEVKLWAYASYF